jgi:small subunit ribosomal protein S21
LREPFALKIVRVRHARSRAFRKSCRVRSLGFRRQSEASHRCWWAIDGNVIRSNGKEPALKVFVRENNVEQALRVLKKKLQREGLFREMKRRRSYEKPSERRAREKGEAIRRGRKAARKAAQREGLLPMPKKRVVGGR